MQLSRNRLLVAILLLFLGLFLTNFLVTSITGNTILDTYASSQNQDVSIYIICDEDDLGASTSSGDLYIVNASDCSAALVVTDLADLPGSGYYANLTVYAPEEYPSFWPEAEPNSSLVETLIRSFELNVTGAGTGTFQIYFNLTQSALGTVVPENVSLFIYEDSDSEWQNLSTSVINGTSDPARFFGVTTHFSKFIIAGKPEPTAPVEEEEEGPPVSPGPGGGGGGGTSCITDWDCTEWSECTSEGIITRICTDKNDCDTISGPDEVELCTYMPPEEPPEEPEEEEEEEIPFITPIGQFFGGLQEFAFARSILILLALVGIIGLLLYARRSTEDELARITRKLAANAERSRQAASEISKGQAKLAHIRSEGVVLKADNQKNLAHAKSELEEHNIPIIFKAVGDVINPDLAEAVRVIPVKKNGPTVIGYKVKAPILVRKKANKMHVDIITSTSLSAIIKEYLEIRERRRSKKATELVKEASIYKKEVPRFERLLEKLAIDLTQILDSESILQKDKNELQSEKSRLIEKKKQLFQKFRQARVEVPTEVKNKIIPHLDKVQKNIADSINSLSDVRSKKSQATTSENRLNSAIQSLNIGIKGREDSKLTTHDITERRKELSALEEEKKKLSKRAGELSKERIAPEAERRRQIAEQSEQTRATVLKKLSNKLILFKTGRFRPFFNRFR